jgi:hypothetical protein
MEKLIKAYLAKKFPAFYGNRNSVTGFARAYP